MTEEAKAAALAALEQRRANPPKQIDNAALWAGSPMYFYCDHCGHESDVKPELYTDVPKHVCSECQVLLDNGWMPEGDGAA